MQREVNKPFYPTMFLNLFSPLLNQPFNLHNLHLIR